MHSGTTVSGLKYLVYLQTTLLERKIKSTSTANHAGNVTALDTEATLYDCGFGTESTIHAVLYFEQIELQAKLLNYFLGSNKSNINQMKRELLCFIKLILWNCYVRSWGFR